MGVLWYYIVIFFVLAGLVAWISDKFSILKSKGLQSFIAILVFTFIYWGVYDLLILFLFEPL